MDIEVGDIVSPGFYGPNAYGVVASAFAAGALLACAVPPARDAIVFDVTSTCVRDDRTLGSERDSLCVQNMGRGNVSADVRRIGALKSGPNPLCVSPRSTSLNSLKSPVAYSLMMSMTSS